MRLGCPVILSNNTSGNTSLTQKYSSMVGGTSTPFPTYFTRIISGTFNTNSTTTIKFGNNYKGMNNGFTMDQNYSIPMSIYRFTHIV